MSIKSANFTYFLLFIALLGYVIPWILTPTAPLSLNAYDLAEWTSLHPSQPTASPSMIVPLLLRLQLMIIAVMVGLHAKTYLQKWGALLLIVLLSLGQLPPLEFLTIETGNINYQQQFLLATVSLLVGGGLIIHSPKRWIPLISIFLLTIGVFSSMSGLQQAGQLYTMSLQENTIGSGVVVTICAYFILLLIYGWDVVQTTINIRDDRVTPEIKQGSI